MVEDRLLLLPLKCPALRRKSENDVRRRPKQSGYGSKPKKPNRNVVLSVKRKKRGGRLLKKTAGLRKRDGKEKSRSRGSRKRNVGGTMRSESGRKRKRQELEKSRKPSFS